MACPPGTYDWGNDKCLTSEFGPKVNGRCPAVSKENEMTIDENMRCIAGFSDKKIVGGWKMCYETQAATNEGKCMFNNDTVFTTRMFTNGAWKCPPGTKDTGITWSDGKIGKNQCLILP
ncbi:hypothetical protein PBCVFr5L_031L [Paramecium bursaria Chlorella virus Fr5L]|nr:hypothetical protein PBCVFr5L_031L [Paramecium bursaria Chlorella virus Fr5L]